MTTVFLNGGAPNYLGYIFTSTSDLLGQIKTTLESAGWTTTTDNITSNNSLTCRGVYGTDNCWIQFSVTSGQNDNRDLHIRGDLDGSASTLSPDTLVMSFVETADNQLWIASDEGGGCICLSSFSGQSSGIHFGFVENRVASDDSTCIYVGYLSTHQYDTYVAGTYYNATNWYHLMDSFFVSQMDEKDLRFAGNSWQIYAWPATWGFTDRFTNNIVYDDVVSTSEAIRPFGAPVRGQVSPITGKPILGEYYYVELNATNGTIPASLHGTYDIVTGLSPGVWYYRGNIRFASVGLASLAAKAQVILANGNRYISVASPPATQGLVGWQGMRIL